jgi:four helix bundle protein
MKSYKDLEIYKMSFALAVKTHELTLLLPPYERYEIGSQLRRSSQSIKDNIVEGYGRRYHKNEFLRFLVFAHASLLESISQLEMIYELYDISESKEISEKYIELGKMINSFTKYVSKSWDTSEKYN